jgi:LacI family repressor for deo operon, udp, cdd, tsx, nupC, and nupG
MHKPKRSVTIHDVARVAGVSIATVSRAFNNPELLSPDARGAIEQAVQVLNYRPHVAARRLRGSRTNLILVVVPSLNPYFLDIFAGAEDAAKAAGYGVLVGHSERVLSRERDYVEQVAAGRADGLILVTTVGGYDSDDITRMPPSVIALDVGEANDLPKVQIDHVAAAEMITSYLIDLGHRRIAHILGAPGSSLTSHRLDGFQRALARRGIAYDPALCLPGDFTVDGGATAAAAIVTMADPPTAVFAANDSERDWVGIYPNNDTGADKIIHMLSDFGVVIPSMRFEYFLTLLRHADCIMGNSSAGIREAPVYGVPSINIGTRQQGRASLRQNCH